MRASFWWTSLRAAGDDGGMIDLVKFVGVPVKDPQRSLEFFRDRLGFRVLTDQPMVEGGKRWIELQIPGGAETRVVLFTPEGQENRVGSFFNGAFGTKDLEKTYEELRARGVEFLQPPTRQPWGTYAVFVDPDRNQFVLSTAP
jgi:catechol 2,3-dioxygenase-like lactoylglutathione lyase family enzyme